MVITGVNTMWLTWPRSARATQATYGMYLDYYHQFANTIEVSPELVEYNLWQMACGTAALQQALDDGGWLSNAIADAFGGGYIDAFDVIEGSLGLTLATIGSGNDRPLQDHHFATNKSAKWTG